MAKFISSKNRDIYTALIRPSLQLPIGFEKLCLEYPIPYNKVADIFKLAHLCVNDTFTRCFQYKVLCQTLPTKEYLFKYKVPDIVNNQCKRCNLERDTIEHCLFDCEKIQPFLNLIKDLIQSVHGLTLNRESIIFGSYQFVTKNKGINHFLLELKKFIFYTLQDDFDNQPILLLKRFLTRMRFLIVKEKEIAIRKDKFDSFAKKWKPFCNIIYNFYGPDNTDFFFK